MEYFNQRRDFGKHSMKSADLPDSPVLLLLSWLEEARVIPIDDFNTMVLSTVGQEGMPSSRVVLLREVDDVGNLIFYSNYLSRKGKELALNPFASVLFFWASLERQIRVEGKIRKLSARQSDEYFYSRPVESQVSAIVSPQSQEIADLKEINYRRDELLNNPQKIKRPEQWGGYCLTPTVFEFWQGGKNRMHGRVLYQKEDRHWRRSRLAP